jgi:hypothetical protein
MAWELTRTPAISLRPRGAGPQPRRRRASGWRSLAVWATGGAPSRRQAATAGTMARARSWVSMPGIMMMQMPFSMLECALDCRGASCRGSLPRARDSEPSRTPRADVPASPWHGRVQIRFGVNVHHWQASHRRFLPRSDARRLEIITVTDSDSDARSRHVATRHNLRVSVACQCADGGARATRSSSVAAARPPDGPHSPFP